MEEVIVISVDLPVPLSCAVHMHDAVRVDIERNFDLRNTAGRGSNARQHKVAQRLVVFAEFAFALQYVNIHARLVIRRRREHLALLHGDGGVSVDDSRKHAAQRFDTEGKRSNVQKKHVFHFAG